MNTFLHLLIGMVPTVANIHFIRSYLRRLRTGAEQIAAVEHHLRRNARLGQVVIVPSRFGRLSVEMLREIAATHGFRYLGERTYGGTVRLLLEIDPALLDGGTGER